jgi:hypothetical protein
MRTRAVQRIRAFKKATITEIFSLNGTVNTKFDYFCYQYCNNQSFSLCFFLQFLDNFLSFLFNLIIEKWIK